MQLASHDHLNARPAPCARIQPQSRDLTGGRAFSGRAENAGVSAGKSGREDLKISPGFESPPGSGDPFADLTDSQLAHLESLPLASRRRAWRLAISALAALALAGGVAAAVALIGPSDYATVATEPGVGP